MIDLNLFRVIARNNSNVVSLSRYIEDTPRPVPPIISQQDVNRGFVDRYFVRSANDKNFLVEVDEIQYQKFKKNPRFIVTKIKWKIIGRKEDEINESGIINRGVRDYNLQQVTKADLTFNGIKRYITDYTQYWAGETLPAPTDNI